MMRREIYERFSIYTYTYIYLDATTQNVSERTGTAVFNVAYAFNVCAEEISSRWQKLCMYVCLRFATFRLKEIEKKKVGILIRTLYTISII